jgi:hypothetical protein
MEILESATWITLGFLPMLGSMELAWRLSANTKRKSKKAMRGLTPPPRHDTIAELKHYSSYFI